MALIDMLTDIKSFNYNKVGKKHDEYFGEDNATGFTTNRNTKDPTEFVEGSGNDFNFKNKVGYSRFEDTNQTGFTIDRNTMDPTEFIIGSGNDFNFTEKRGFSTFNVSTSYTIDRDTGDETELPDGGGSLYSKKINDFRAGLSRVDFFGNEHRPGFLPNLHNLLKVTFFTGLTSTEFDTNSSLYSTGLDAQILTGRDGWLNLNASGFTTKRTTKDKDTDGETFAGEYILGSSDYDNIITAYENFPGLSTAVFNNSDIPLRDSMTMQNDGTYSMKQYSVLNTGYGQIRMARSVDNRDTGINLGNEVPKESKEYITSSPNKPTTYSEGHVYGAPISRLALEDRKGDIDNQYIKFGGGNAGLRPGYASNANQGVFGFDSPYVIKELTGDESKDGYASLDWAVDGTITILPFKIIRTAEDVIRVGKWNLTAKGIMWNANQFMLQAQNARWETRFFNPIGPLGSLVPHVHVPRHPGNAGLTDVENPTGYSDNAFDKDDIHAVREPASNALAEAGNDMVDAGLKGLGIHYENRMENLRTYRIEKDKGPVPNLNPLASLGVGFGNKEFVDPKHHQKSMKGPDGGDILEKTEDGVTLEEKHGWMITKYSDLTKFNELKSTGQGHVVGVDRSLLNMEEMSADGEVIKIDEKQESGAVLTSEVGKVKSPKRNKTLASDYNLGKGLISKGDKLYEVGVSNMLQVPYGGQFNKLTDSIEKLPKDFINFRIRDAVNGKWLIFPAHLGAITDTVSPEWTKEAYIGRPDEVHIYTKTSRTVGFDFKVAAFTKQEIPIIQEKMNYLVGLGYPTFKKMLPTDVEERPVSPYIYLTIGDLFNNTPGYFDSITISTEENYTWEIDEGFQTPMMYNVAVNFVYIGRHLPQTLGKHYDVPWLKDSGAGPNKYGTFGSQDPRDESKESIRPTIHGDQAWSTNVVPHEAL